MKVYQRSEVSRKIKLITESKYLDLIGLLIVVGGSISLGFHKTVKPLDLFGFQIENYPLGIQSVLTVAFSMIATRFVTRRNNIGNFIGVFTTISTCMVDYMLGNKAAILTYPISMFGNYYSFYLWNKHKEIIPIDVDKGFYINFIYGFSISFFLNYLGFTEFLTKPIEDIWLFLTIVTVVGLTFGGQFNTAKRYKENWFTWQIYNVFKLRQYVKQGNIAYILKYIFYFFNAVLGWLTWHEVKKESDFNKEQDVILNNSGS
jgi:nicotinamide mononucleotide transporter PnuC